MLLLLGPIMTESKSTEPPNQPEVDPKLMKLLAEYLHSEKAENGWRKHFRESLEAIHQKIDSGQIATQDIANQVLEINQDFATHIEEEERSLESIRGYIATHKTWQAAVDKKLNARDDWDEITGQHVVEELRQKRESDRARSINKRKVLWWVLGIVGFLVTNAGSAFMSQCASTPEHVVQVK